MHDIRVIRENPGAFDEGLRAPRARKGRADLCLSARTLEEHDQVARDGERHGTAEV
jgi:hypothetical protein